MYTRFLLGTKLLCFHLIGPHEVFSVIDYHAIIFKYNLVTENVCNVFITIQICDYKFILQYNNKMNIKK